LFTFREHVHYLDKWPWDLRDVDDRVGDRLELIFPKA